MDKVEVGKCCYRRQGLTVGVRKVDTTGAVRDVRVRTLTEVEKREVAAGKKE